MKAINIVNNLKTILTSYQSSYLFMLKGVFVGDSIGSDRYPTEDEFPMVYIEFAGETPDHQDNDIDVKKITLDIYVAVKAYLDPNGYKFDTSSEAAILNIAQKVCEVLRRNQKAGGEADYMFINSIVPMDLFFLDKPIGTALKIEVEYSGAEDRAYFPNDDFKFTAGGDATGIHEWSVDYPDSPVITFNSPGAVSLSINPNVYGAQSYKAFYDDNPIDGIPTTEIDTYSSDPFTVDFTAANGGKLLLVALNENDLPISKSFIYTLRG